MFFLFPIRALVLLFMIQFGLGAESEVLSVHTFKKNYFPGEPIVIHTEISEEGYLYLLNQRTDGTIHLLYPNEKESDNFLRPGKHRFPPKERDYEWTLEEDSGDESLILILSKKKIASLHKNDFRKDESIFKTFWLRRLTSTLHPSRWWIREWKFKVLPVTSENGTPPS
ncbi:MAG: DUF4384 domain-containing protein [Leptospiraceae bacterium]|nr:DUF4384 domain-containing protein [Leptospiraceae bacterium]MCP5512481.1 DUF4384 domain-containing protein [Leptospiraceae bacterium]